MECRVLAVVWSMPSPPDSSHLAPLWWQVLPIARLPNLAGEPGVLQQFVPHPADPLL